jgi:hypothetical protein
VESGPGALALHQAGEAGGVSNAAAIQQAREQKQLLEVSVGQELLSRVRGARAVANTDYVGRCAGCPAALALPGPAALMPGPARDSPCRRLPPPARWGEELAYRYLADVYLRHGYEVEWVNEAQESGLPYDIVVRPGGGGGARGQQEVWGAAVLLRANDSGSCLACVLQVVCLQLAAATVKAWCWRRPDGPAPLLQVVYVEVKSTSAHAKHFFEVSCRWAGRLASSALLGAVQPLLAATRGGAACKDRAA